MQVLLAAGAAAGAVTAVLVLAGLLWRRAGRPLALMARDWHGEPARPGVPARLGVMPRLAQLEATQQELVARVARVEARLSPGWGSGVKASVDGKVATEE